MSDSELPLVGDLRWSDAALGWVATWSLEASGRRYRWSVRGVNYDEAFRNAVRGAARVLSGRKINLIKQRRTWGLMSALGHVWMAP